MSFTVTQVIDGDTLAVKPNWSWEDESGSRVRLAGVNAPELNEYGGPAAKRRLSDLVLNATVELKNAKTFSYGRLVCDVFLNGRNVANSL